MSVYLGTNCIDYLKINKQKEKTVKFIDYDGEILHEYSKDEFLALSSMPANPGTSRFKRIYGAVITDPQENFFNGITNDEGKISFNVVDIKSWEDYPHLTVDGIVFNNTTLNDFFDNMLDKVAIGHHDTVTITINNIQYKIVVDWPADGELGTLQLLKLQENLISQGWNWSLSDAQEYVEEWGYLNIGQMYITQSGDTEIDVEFPEDSVILSPYLGIAVNGEVDIDWGDNSTHSTVTGTSLTDQIRTQHTYSQSGNYTIKIHVNSGSFAFYVTNTYLLLNANNSDINYNKIYSSRVKNIRIGENCVISTYAFQHCYSLQSITIPNTVTSIGTYAFQYCYSLSSITIPDGVTTLNSDTFSYCHSLQSATIPNSVINFYRAFSYCTSLSSLIIPSSSTTISILDSCTPFLVKIIPEFGVKMHLKNVDITIPNTVNSIYDYWFQYCYSLSSITIPNTVTSIGKSAFYGCYFLKSVTISEGVISIGNSAFRNCYSLNSVIIPSTVTLIDNYAFSRCYSLKSIIIPSGVTSISTYAFEYCESLQSIAIPSGVTSIGSSAFQHCYSLQSITIPNTVTSIGTYAFQNCSSLQSITIPDTVTSISSYTFQNCYSLQSITIPDTVTLIGSYTFRDCYSLNSVIIPSTVTLIGTYAFYECYSLKEVHLKSTTPPSLSSTNAFSGVPSDCIFYVPQGTLSAYQSATNWSTYASKMQEESN